MKLARYLVAVATTLALTAIPATADSVNEGWNAGELGGWQAITDETVVEAS